MKKLLLVIAMVAVGFTANAQKINFGAKAGVNFADITGIDEATKSITVMHFGAMAEIEISEKFSVQPELLYSAQGTKAKVGDGKTNFNYINVPVMAKYYVAEGLSLEAGPQIGFLTAAEVNNKDAKAFYNTVDFALNFGAGYKLPSGLNFSARYNVGLSELAKDKDANSASSNNRVFQISVGYFF